MTLPKSASQARETGPAFNPHVAALPSYNAGLPVAVAREISGHNFIARLASNENPFGCSPKVMAALASGSPSLDGLPERTAETCRWSAPVPRAPRSWSPCRAGTEAATFIRHSYAS